MRRKTHGDKKGEERKVGRNGKRLILCVLGRDDSDKERR